MREWPRNDDDQLDDQSQLNTIALLPFIVRLAFYVVVGIAVAYAIVHFWPPYFDLRRPH